MRIAKFVAFKKLKKTRNAQMQYGSIGWAVGAALGYAAALRGKKRLILSIGDGSFQVTAQVRELAANCRKCIQR